MQTAIGSSISMKAYNSRDQGSATTKDHKISTSVKTNDYEDQRSTANHPNVKTYCKQ